MKLATTLSTTAVTTTVAAVTQSPSSTPLKVKTTEKVTKKSQRRNIKRWTNFFHFRNVVYGNGRRLVGSGEKARKTVSDPEERYEHRSRKLQIGRSRELQLGKIAKRESIHAKSSVGETKRETLQETEPLSEGLDLSSQKRSVRKFEIRDGNG